MCERVEFSFTLTSFNHDMILENLKNNIHYTDYYIVNDHLRYDIYNLMVLDILLILIITIITAILLSPLLLLFLDKTNQIYSTKKVMKKKLYAQYGLICNLLLLLLFYDSVIPDDIFSFIINWCQNI